MGPGNRPDPIYIYMYIYLLLLSSTTTVFSEKVHLACSVRESLHFIPLETFLAMLQIAGWHVSERQAPKPLESVEP